jgi:hypothetical protein
LGWCGCWRNDIYYDCFPISLACLALLEAVSMFFVFGCKPGTVAAERMRNQGIRKYALAGYAERTAQVQNIEAVPSSHVPQNADSHPSARSQCLHY